MKRTLREGLEYFGSRTDLHPPTWYRKTGVTTILWLSRTASEWGRSSSPRHSFSHRPLVKLRCRVAREIGLPFQSGSPKRSNHFTKAVSKGLICRNQSSLGFHDTRQKFVQVQVQVTQPPQSGAVNRRYFRLYAKASEAVVSSVVGNTMPTRRSVNAL